MIQSKLRLCSTLSIFMLFVSMVIANTTINFQNDRVFEAIPIKFPTQNQQFSEETEAKTFLENLAQSKAVSSKRFTSIPVGVTRAGQIDETLRNKQFEGGNGTSANPYQIASIAQFKELSTNATLLNGYFKLVSDLSFVPSDYDDANKKWKPIGNATHPFTGSFDGNNYQINNLEITRPLESNIGLFGKVTGDLKNIHLENVTIVGSFQVGALVGFLEDGSVSRSTSGLHGPVTATVTSVFYPSPLGGLVGYSVRSTITHSYSSINVSKGIEIGGLIGSATESVINSSGADFYYNSTTVPHIVGGLLGGANKDVIITNSYANMYLELPNVGTVGGLVGAFGGTGNIINSSFAVSTFNSTAVQLGGLLGRSATGTLITNSYAITTLEKDSSGNFGGLVGDRQTITVNKSYAIITAKFSTPEHTYVPILGSFTGSATPEVLFSYYSTTNNNFFYNSDLVEANFETIGSLSTNTTLFDAWDTENIWKVGNNQLPTLRMVSGDEFNPQPLNVLSSISELTYLSSSTGNELTWSITGSLTGVANLYLDGQQISELPWNTFTPLNVSIDGLSAGETYNYTLEAVFGQLSSSSTVFVSVIGFPSLTKPSDVAYNFSETNNRIIWQSNGAENSGLVTLYRNGTEIDTRNWEAMSNFSFLIDDLAVGIHNFTLVLIDEFNITISDTVMVTVNSADFRISAPTSVLYDIDASEKVLIFDLTAVGTFGTASLYLNDILFDTTTTWVSSSELIYDISSIPVGSYDLKLVVTDFLGVTLTRTIQVNITSFPTFSAKELNYEFGIVSNFLNWTMSGSQTTGDLQLLLNGSEVFSSQWVGSQSFSQNIDGLSTGLHEFQLKIIDSFAIQTSYTVLVRVYLPFSISSPNDFIYAFGTTNNSITWTLSGVGNRSGNAVVFLDNVEFGLVEEWADSLVLAVNVDGLPVGQYNFTVKIFVTSDFQILDTVQITVTGISTTNTTSPASSTHPTNSMTSSPSGLLNSLLIIIVPSGIVFVTGVALFTGYMVLRRRKRNAGTPTKNE